MAARIPSVANAAIEVCFIVAAGVLGAMRAPLWGIAALAAGMILYWAYNRRVGLSALAAQGFIQVAGAVIVSLAMMFAILGAVYWLGTLIGRAAA